MFRSKTILDKCKTGDRRAQRTFYDEHRKSLYYTVLRYARNQEDAKDILQEGFIQIFRDLHQFDDSRGSLNTWLTRVMINAALRFNQKNVQERRSQLESLEVHLVHDRSESSANADFSTKEILQVIQEMPDGYRSVFNLFVMEGYSHQEIAGYLEISPNTSKSQLSKAKAYIRSALEKSNRQKIHSPSLTR